MHTSLLWINDNNKKLAMYLTNYYLHNFTIKTHTFNLKFIFCH